jgi:superfamily II DNA or RNA helicase
MIGWRPSFRVGVAVRPTTYLAFTRPRRRYSLRSDGVRKTAVAAWLIAKRKVDTLVVAHRQQLLDQWQERLAMFLDLPAKSVGHIGGGKADRTGCVDVAVIQSLYRKDEVKDFVAEYGQVIVDECHHISASTFEQALST